MNKPPLQTTHGKCYTSECKAWYSLRDRCLNPRNKSFANYGGRGITICQRWIESFENFLSDMGKKPSPLHSIDRINVNGNYEPSNCKWSSQKEQGNNKRTNVCLTYEGKTMTVSQWAEKLGVDKRRIHWRIKNGWSIERTLAEAQKGWE